MSDSAFFYTFLGVFVVLAGFSFLVATYLFLTKAKESKPSKTSILKRLVFVFKWWLIGRMHCDVDYKTKAFFKLLHKIFWGCIIASVVLTFARFLQILDLA